MLRLIFNSNMDQPSETLFEESEVLWAKIRGYPWWPAYVSEVHFAQSPADYEYTIIFFGDNTNSRLGPSKLRKFPDFYSECYAKTKTNKKLKQSIEKAEQRLRENQQDVSIYEHIRNQMKIKKKRGPMSQSRLSSSQKGDALDAPDLSKYKNQLVKHKTHQISRNNTKQKQKKESQFFEQEQSQSDKQQSANSVKKTNQKEVIKPPQQLGRRRSQVIKMAAMSSPSKKIQAIPIQQQVPAARSRRILRVSRDNIQSPKQEIQKSNAKSRQKKDSDTRKQQCQQQKQKTNLQEKPHDIRRRRKGRPPKSEQQKQIFSREEEDNDQIQSEKQSSKEDEQIQSNLMFRRGRKRLSENSRLLQQKEYENSSIVSNEIGVLSQKEVDKIRSCLKNRKQLTKVLLQMPINAGNIKQILDLGVSLVLQQGPINKNIHLLLCTLKATLLHKYFPDDNKHRKKFQKMTKEKKKAIIHEDQQDNEENNMDIVNSSFAQNHNKVIDEKTNQKLEQKSFRNSNIKKGKQKQKHYDKELILSSEQAKHKQIRMKATVKLQKMIKKSGLEEGAKQFAMKIENTFQQTAETKGDLYRNIAYERLRTIKTRLAQLSERTATPNEIKSYLEQALHNYQSDNYMHPTND